MKLDLLKKLIKEAVKEAVAEVKKIVEKSTTTPKAKNTSSKKAK